MRLNLIKFIPLSPSTPGGGQPQRKEIEYTKFSRPNQLVGKSILISSVPFLDKKPHQPNHVHPYPQIQPSAKIKNKQENLTLKKKKINKESNDF